MKTVNKNYFNFYGDVFVKLCFCFELGILLLNQSVLEQTKFPDYLYGMCYRERL